ncbi:MAG: SIS domain-containing protein [Acidimicrobiia bacterium]
MRSPPGSIVSAEGGGNVSMRAEILEQPGALRHALEANREPIANVAAAVTSHDFNYAMIAARGTSDNAARYGKYLLAAHNRIPVALAAPSLFTSYDRPPRLDGALVIGISQSGESPDLIAVLEEASHQGRPTIAITNEPESPLAGQADAVIDIMAGREMAIAATKTYTAELLAIAMLSAALDPGAWADQLTALPGHAQSVLDAEEHIAALTGAFADMGACAVLGRGYNHCTAFEWALKLQEVTYTLAHPYSSADFRHGPIAVVEPGFPILAVAMAGPLFGDMMALLQKATTIHRARTVAITNRSEALHAVHSGVMLPDMPEWMTPIAAIVAAQLFTLHLGEARGLDPERPRGLTKVTRTI